MHQCGCEVLTLLFPLQLTSQEHTPQVIQRALEKHNMEDFSCSDFGLYQVLKNGKGEYLCFTLQFKQSKRLSAGVTCSEQNEPLSVRTFKLCVSSAFSCLQKHKSMF